MMVWSINLLVLAIGLLIVGMFKPNWILFWMEKPGRMPIICLSSALFMAAAIMFGEANMQKQKQITKQTQQSTIKEDARPTVANETDKVDEKVGAAIDEMK